MDRSSGPAALPAPTWLPRWSGQASTWSEWVGWDERAVWLFPLLMVHAPTWAPRWSGQASTWSEWGGTNVRPGSLDSWSPWGRRIQRERKSRLCGAGGLTTQHTAHIHTAVR